MASASAADADNQINGATVAVDAAEDTVDSSNDFIEIGTNDTGGTHGVVLGSSNENNAGALSQSSNNEILTDIEYTGNYSELNDLIRLSEGSILLTKNYKYAGNGDDNKIIVSKSIVIDGGGHTINGNNAVMSFEINANNVELTNINVIDTYSSTDAGSIIWNGENGKLSN
jgi:hypothetical protein